MTLMSDSLSNRPACTVGFWLVFRASETTSETIRQVVESLPILN